MADDNTITNFLNSGVGTEGHYYNILNRRTAMDDVGDAFTDQSKYPAVNAAQKNENALMAGIGAGFKASQSAIRGNKLQKIEAQLEQVAKLRTNLQTQLGQRQLTQATFANFALNNYGDLKKWNEARGAGDQQAENEIGMALYNKFATENPDLTKGMGKIDHILNGKAYFDKEGKIGGMAVNNLVEPLVSQLPEDQQRELSNLTSETMRNKFSKSDLLENLSLKEKQAEIDQRNAAADQAYAHADYYRGETAKNEYERLNPPKYDAKTTQHIIKENSTWVNELRKKHKTLKTNIDIYGKIKSILEEESSLLGRGGSSFFTKALRAINTSTFSSDSAKNQALIGLYQKHLLAGLKDTFGNRVSNLDLTTFLEGIPNLDKDPRAAIQVAGERIDEYVQELKEDEVTREVLENEFGYREPYNSLAVQKRVQEKMKIDTGNDILNKD